MIFHTRFMVGVEVIAMNSYRFLRKGRIIGPILWDIQMHITDKS